jgi:3-oxoacid CoA-transferase subunit B
MTMKERLDETTIALRVAKELQDGWYVNLGFGIPTLAASFLPEGRSVFFQSENGLLGYGGTATLEEAAGMGWLYVDAAAQPVFPAPGMAIFDYGDAFDMIRGGHLDLTVLGGLQVSERGDLANWRMPMYTGKAGTIGGAMDLAASARRVYVAMTHTEKGDRPKIVRECKLALTAKRCVHRIFTDLAVIDVTEKGLVLEEKAPGWSVEEIQALTEPKLIVAEDLKDIEL